MIKDKKEYMKKYYQNNCEKIKNRSLQRYLDNPKEIKARIRQWRLDNPDKVKSYEHKYYQAHKIKINKYKKNRLKTNPKFNLDYRLKTAIKNSLKKNKSGHYWEALVGYTLNDLIKHLKKNMPKSYTWQDYLDGKLQTDHIVPISAFNYTNPKHIDFKRCWALKNLRLLPARENTMKGNKLLKPFQPALNI